jgi:hypothetical protein
MCFSLKDVRNEYKSMTTSGSGFIPKIAKKFDILIILR